MSDFPYQSLSDVNSTPSPETQPIGQRRLFYFNDNGQPAYQVYDLAIDDYLNPQPGDEFFHGAFHDHCTRFLTSMLLYHYRYSPNTGVQIKSKLVGTDRSLPQPVADAVVVSHLLEPLRQRPTLDLAAEQAASSEGEFAMRAIFEVTSPRLADTILVTKRTLYERLGAAEYWVIDTGLRPDIVQPHLQIIGYQLRDGVFQPVEPTAELRWESKACRIWLTVSEDRQSFQLGDLRTGAAFPVPADDEDPTISTQAEASRRAQSIAGQLKL